MKRLLVPAALAAVLLVALLGPRGMPAPGPALPGPASPAPRAATPPPARPTPPASPPARTAGRITGHVAAATPVAGAEVAVGTLDLARDGGFVTAPTVRRGRTDMLGYFEFRDLPPGRYRVACEPAGLGPAFADALVLPGETAEVRLLPVPGIALDVEVLVASGPAAGASVEAWISVAGTEYGRLGPALRSAVTDDSGRARLDALPADQRVHLLVRHPLGRPHEETLGLLEGPTSRRLVLEAGAGISGTVRRRDGSPIPGARVKASQGTAYEQEARSGPDGGFVLGGLDPGPLTVLVQAEGYVQRLHRRPGPGDGMVLELLRPGRLRGRAPGARVVQASGPESIHRLPPGEDGTFVLEGLMPGTWRVMADDGPAAVVELPEEGTVDVGTLEAR